jgi:hypothetical protein
MAIEEFKMLFVLMSIACTGGEAEPGEPALEGVAALGHQSNSLADLSVEVFAGSAEGLDRPLDLEFNPDKPGELWIVNQDDDSTTVLFGAGESDQSSRHDVDPFALHFMEEVSSIAFGAPGTFGTCQESRNTYNGQGQPNDFMGPALWSSDFEIYAKTNPEAEAYLNYDLGSHLDMLHESPLCMGIAWEKDNVYWAFDGGNATLARYDFQADHGPGYDDHSDGIVAKYVIGEISRVEGVPSHVVYDGASGLLYVADTGNNRIAVLDTNSGERGRTLQASEPGVDQFEMINASFETLIDGAEYGLGEPSGLALVNGLIYVSDFATGNLFAFELDGDLLDWAPTERPGIAGIEVVDEKELWFVDSQANEAIRILAD